ncbi:NAD(P)H-dependent oxidoreductase [Curtobacterium flaccumfaciens]|nr:NAD(P)H-dependent oxidoreductase [Curtobacterium flaccumfaciens]
MPTLLHIDSSADLAHSRSRALTAAFADAWRARGPEYTVVRRDLHVDQLPHLETSALHWAAADRTGDEVVAPTPRRSGRRSSTSSWPPTSSWSGAALQLHGAVHAQGLDRPHPHPRRTRR